MTIKRKRKPQKNMHYFFLDVGGKTPIRLGVKVRDASQKVILSRNIIDIAKGNKGMSITCANAICALRMGTEAFPHPVLMAEFTDTRCYMVDKLSPRGVPVSCVKYAHDQGDFQKKFDTKSKQSLAKTSGAEALFLLSPPPQLPETRNSAGHGRSDVRKSSSGTPYKLQKKRPLSKGAVARALRSGIVLDIKKAKEEEKEAA